MNAARRANIGEPCRHVDGVPPKVKAELASANHSSDDGADVEPAAQVPASRRSSCRLDQCKRAGKRRHDRVRVRQEQAARREEGITDRLDLLQSVLDGEVFENLDQVLQLSDHRLRLVFIAVGREPGNVAK